MSILRTSAAGSFCSAGRKAGELAMFGAIPIMLTLGMLVASFRLRSFAFDFHGDLYNAGRAILNGNNPYHFGFLAHQAALKGSGETPSLIFAVPVYPAPSLLAAVPLSLLPFRLAGALFACINVVCLISAMRLLGVRDWRCVGAVFLSYPVLHGLTLGAIDGILVLGAAAVWRWRDCLSRPAIALAAIVVAKLFMWPLAFWMLVTRRRRALGLAVLVAGVGTLASWAVVGSSSFFSYPALLGNLSSILHGSGASIPDLLGDAGVSGSLGRVAAAAVTGALLGTVWRLAGQRGQHHRAFGLAVMTSLAASPIVWPHYFALVYIPIAMMAPRLSPLWLVPLLAYLSPAELTHGDVWRIVPYLAIEVMVISSLLRSTRSSPDSAVSPLRMMRHLPRVIR